MLHRAFQFNVDLKDFACKLGKGLSFVFKFAMFHYLQNSVITSFWIWDKSYCSSYQIHNHHTVFSHDWKHFFQYHCEWWGCCLCIFAPGVSWFEAQSHRHNPGPCCYYYNPKLSITLEWPNPVLRRLRHFPWVGLVFAPVGRSSYLSWLKRFYHSPSGYSGVHLGNWCELTGPLKCFRHLNMGTGRFRSETGSFTHYRDRHQRHLVDY